MRTWPLEGTVHRSCSICVTAFAVTVATIAVFGTSPVRADDDFPPEVERACGGDARRLCPSDKPGSAGMRYCMEAKQNYFSKRCKRALEDSGVAPRGYFTKK